MTGSSTSSSSSFATQSPLNIQKKNLPLELKNTLFWGSSINLGNLGLLQKLSLLEWPTQNFRLVRNCCHSESRTCCEKCVWAAVTKWESQKIIARSPWAVIKTGWWLNQPIWKILVPGRGENKKCLSCHHLENLCAFLLYCLVNRDRYNGLFLTLYNREVKSCT